MKAEAALHKTGGTTEIVTPANNKHFTLQELQRYVGGYIEVVYLSKKLIMVLNEEGKLNKLPINERATTIYLKANKNDDVIVGDVLVMESKLME